jgi:hypothetical protein
MSCIHSTLSTATDLRDLEYGIQPYEPIMSLVKEVTERSSASSAAPPAPPTPSQSGFPQVQHRSQRISQFKRARGAATAGPSARPYSNAPPVVQTSRSDGPAFRTGSEPDLAEREATGRSTQDLLKDCQDENDAKIAGMSRLERDHELEELESMISPDLLAMLRSRAEKKAQQQTAGPSSFGEEKPSGMVAALTGEPVAQSQQIEEAKHVEQDVTVVESEDTGAGKRGE